MSLAIAEVKGIDTSTCFYKQQRELLTLIDLIVSKFLDEDDKYIIENEVVNGKVGDWYYEQLACSTYYRHRRKAYNNFLTCLEK